MRSYTVSEGGDPRPDGLVTFADKRKVKIDAKRWSRHGGRS